LHPLGCVCRPPHIEYEPVLDPRHLDLLAGRKLLAVRGSCTPQLTAYRDETAAADLPELTDDVGRSDGNRPASGLNGLPEEEGPERSERGGDRDDEWDRRVVRRGRV